MSLLARAKSASHFLSSSANHLFYCRHSITALQQCNFYATKTTPTKPRTRKPPTSPPLLSQGINNPVEASKTVWPKPGEMPYQAKVANFVNLVGNVEIPVKFESDSDGKHFASTVISVGNGDKKDRLLIPVVCEGDLAHSVACHVKQDNRVFVAGQLSADPLKMVQIENLGKFHVVAENLCFVEGFEKAVSDKKVGASIWGSSIETSLEPLPEAPTLELEDVQRSGDKGGKSVTKKTDLWELWRDLLNNSLEWFDYRKHKTNGLLKETFPDFKKKGTEDALWVRSAPDWVMSGLGRLECDVPDFKPESKQVQGAMNPNAKLEDSWKNWVENPNKWWDNRVGKKYPKQPDFKHKETGEVLWLSSAPEWALARPGKLKSDVQDFKPESEQVQGGIKPSAGNRNAKLEDSWKNWVENPNKWWDNRVDKKNPKYPDFKHKETGEMLWLNTAPEWAQARLGKLENDVQDFNQKPKQVQGGMNPSAENKNAKPEDSWKNLVENPKKWWDNRVGKKNPKAPDFKHKETGEALWLTKSPEWALSKLPPVEADRKPKEAAW